MKNKDWIVTRIELNLDSRSAKQFPLMVRGVNLNHDNNRYGETERYFSWRLANVYDESFDTGNAFIADDVPLCLMQDCRRNG